MKKLLFIAMLCSFAFAQVFAADKEYNVDLVIVGAGAGGLTAAVSAQEKGLSTVLLEKKPAVGGTGNFMEGTYAVESFMQKEAGVKLTKQQAFNEVMSYHHWKSNPRLVKAIIDQSAETIKWIWDHGVHFEEVKTAWLNKPNKTWHIFPESGSNYIKAMVNIYTSKGGTLLTETPGKKLLLDKNGAVTGVIAENEDGEVIQVNAKSVILATGGYASNLEMIKKYGGPESFPTVLGSYGDGINMALSAGAALDGMGPLMLNGAFMLAPGEAICNGKNTELRAMFRQSLLYVNSHGERFFNEEVTIDWPLASNAISREGKFTYVVFDAETLKEFQTKGYLNGCGNWIKRGQPMKKFDELFPDNEKKGNAFSGKTLDEVAKKAGFDPEAFKQTAKEITKYAKQGKDERFGKNPRTLRAVEKGPFYVLKGQLHHLTSLGGSRVTEHLQVVNEQGNVIPGLYAVGGDAGGMYGDSYDLTIAEGAASSFAINGARLAVKNIVATGK